MNIKPYFQIVCFQVQKKGAVYALSVKRGNMNVLNQININDIEFSDLLRNLNDYSDEVLGAVLCEIKNIAGQVREAQLLLEAHVIERMARDNATKMLIKSFDGTSKMLTRCAGAKNIHKNAEAIILQAGFNPVDYGDYIYKPSWSKSKEARKLGGLIQSVLDEVFKPGKEYIKINTGK
jgi:hypothetical protein